MANISKIQLPDGDTYDLVDEVSGYVTDIVVGTPPESLVQDGVATIPVASRRGYGVIRLYEGSAVPDGSAWLIIENESTYNLPTLKNGKIPSDFLPTIPTKTSQLTNDSGFITNAGVTKITTTAGAHTAISNATGAISFNVPTKTSHLTNDSGYLTLSTLPIYDGTVV